MLSAVKESFYSFKTISSRNHWLPGILKAFQWLNIYKNDFEPVTANFPMLIIT